MDFCAGGNFGPGITMGSPLGVFSVGGWEGIGVGGACSVSVGGIPSGG